MCPTMQQAGGGPGSAVRQGQDRPPGAGVVILPGAVRIGDGAHLS